MLHCGADILPGFVPGCRETPSRRVIFSGSQRQPNGLGIEPSYHTPLRMASVVQWGMDTTITYSDDYLTWELLRNMMPDTTVTFGELVDSSTPSDMLSATCTIHWVLPDDGSHTNSSDA